MIYLVDMTCHSNMDVSKIEKTLQAKRIGHTSWWAIVTNPSLKATISNVIWAFVWDDSPFSGNLFEKAMRSGRIPMERSFFAELNDLRTLFMWKSQLMVDIDRKFGPWRDHVYIIPSGDGTKMEDFCNAALYLERKLSYEDRVL